MAKTGKVEISAEYCKACALCVENCPADALKISNRINDKGYTPAEQIPDRCTGCAICALMCPEAAIEVWRE